jgi:hypothetical protein
MRKKYLVLLGAVLIGLVFHACSLPDSINFPKKVKIKGSPEYNLLLNATDIDMGRMFIDMIRLQLTDLSEYFTIDIWEVNYGNRQEALTFLIKLSTTLTNSMNPGTYLNGAGFKDINLDELSSEPFDINYSIDAPSIEIKQTVPIDFSFLLDSATPGIPFTIPAGINIPSISIPDSTIDENTTGFLHAEIEDVEFEIDFEEDSGGSVLTGFSPGFTFKVHQETDTDSPGGPYPGLSDGTVNLSHEKLKNKTINRKELTFSGGIINIDPQGATLVVSQEDKDAGTLTKNLTVTMRITKLSGVKWDFEEISEQFKIKASSFPPYSLAEPAKYVKELDFDPCDETGSTGIGLKARFEKVISGLALTIKCDDIKVNDKKDLKKDTDIVFGNTNGLVEFKLEKYKDDVGFLEYELELTPASGTNVLEIEELTLGEPLEIKGSVKFFHEWTRAILDMKSIIKFANIEEDDFAGEVPDVLNENEENRKDPIDLSILKDYFEGGITLDNVKTEVYISGPEGAFPPTDLPELEFSAQLVSDPGELLGGRLLYDGPLKLGNPVKIDLENDYYKSETLPPGGMELDDTPFTKLIEIILNKAPADLFFQYNLKMDDELIVTREMFDAATDVLGDDEEDEEGDVIHVDVLILLPLKFRITEEGFRMDLQKYLTTENEDDSSPGTDIFSREKPGDETFLSDVNLTTLHVSLEFPEQIFNGGTIKLFSDGGEERSDPLFPNGIPLTGRSLGVNVSGDSLARVLGSTDEARLLILDPVVLFVEGNTITIPRNMGLMSIKLGFSGDYTVNTDDLGLW